MNRYKKNAASLEEAVEKERIYVGIHLELSI